mgnify:CR=1 FL=1
MTTNVAQCIRAKAEAGKITREAAKSLAQRFDEILAEKGDRFAASDQLLTEVNSAAKRNEWTKLHELMRQKEARDRIATHIGRGESPKTIAKSFMEFVASQQIGEQSVYRQFEAVRNNAHGIMAEAIEEFRSRFGGLREAPSKNQIALEENVIREKMGENTGDEGAKKVASAIGEGLEYLRTEFNRNGGNIAFRENYMPQVHSPTLVGRVSEDDWINEIMPLLDRERMVDENTGALFTDDALRDVLRDTYEAIRTRGLADLDPEKPKIGQGVTDRHQNRRFLQFKDADSWLAYHRKFGPGGNPANPAKSAGATIRSVFQHVDVMARDTATLRVLGPNPTATMRVAAADLQQRTGTDTFDLMQNHFREATGKLNIPAGPADETAAGLGITARNVLQSAILGQAFFSALTDIGFSQTAARFSGMKQIRLMGRQLKLLNPASASDRRQAVRTLGAAEGALDAAQAAARVSTDSLGDPNTVAGVTRNLNEKVMRLSLLQPWTEGMRRGFGMEILGLLTENSKLSLDQLPDQIRRPLERNGIDSATWDAIRNSPQAIDPETKANFITPIEMARNGEREASNALQAMISAETEFAIPTNFVNARTFLRRGRAGTFIGEATRTAGMLKNFPVTVMMLQTGRMAQQQGKLNKAKYGAYLFITTGIMGILAEQLATISNGQEPKPMFGEEGTGKTIGSGLWRAGSFGLMGDLVFANYEKFGSSFAESLAGPGISAISDLVQATSGNAFQTFTNPDIRKDLFAGRFSDVNEQTGLGRDLVKFAEDIQPGGTLWWAKAIQQRIIWDEIQKQVDPEFEASFDREKQLAEDQGAEFFFEPGSFRE